MAETSMAEPSEITVDSLKAKIMEALQTTHVDVEDMSGGCGQAFSAVIVSPQFEKKTTLARHRLVNTALREQVAAIHAWTPKCYTPEQWKQQGQEGAEPKASENHSMDEVVHGTV